MGFGSYGEPGYSRHFTLYTRDERRGRSGGDTRAPQGRTLTPYTKAWAKARAKREARVRNFS